MGENATLDTERQRAADALLNATNIVLASHVNPDGDTIGSVLALVHALQILGKKTTPISTDGIPALLKWLPGVDQFSTTTDQRGFDLAVVCDAGAIERIGRSKIELVNSAPILLNIDHHIPDVPFGHIRMIDSTAAATAELVYDLLVLLEERTGIALRTKEVALALQTGIITDTGGLRFQNVTARTLKLAAILQELGAEPAYVSEFVFETRPLAGLKLLGRALENLRVTEDGHIAWTTVTAKDFQEFNATDADTEGIVTHVRSVEGVKIGVLFREASDNKIRISLRAREGADVNRIANVFGGGGHRLAAGCSLQIPMEEAIERILAECRRSP